MRSWITLVAVATTMALTGAAGAADLGGDNKYTSFKDEVPYVRPFSWTGTYIGAQLGYAWSDVDAVSGPFPGAINQSYGYDADGFIGGGYLGYNWQSQGFVFGVEADVEYTDLDGSGVGNLGTRGHATDVNWMGSMRARLGFTADRALFYVTGGWAFADVDVTKRFVPGGTFASYGDYRNGWTLGVGTEIAFADNLIGRLEYRYTDFGSDSAANAAGNWQDDSDLTMQAVRAGLALKF